MTNFRNMIIGAAALAAGGVSAMPAAADPGPPARLIVGVYDPAAPASLTKAEWPFGCYYADGWHGPGYYWCGYQPGAYYSYRPAYYGYYRPVRYSYYHRRYHRVRHAWRRERRHWRA